MGTLTKKQQEVLARIERTTEQFFSKQEFLDLLSSGKKLSIKFGVDVTSPSIHTGNAVNLWMMRSLQDLGHKVIFLIGDFTTLIGDPTGRDKKRPALSEEEIAHNAEAFIEQAKMVLRFDDPDLLEIRRNSEWLNKLSMKDFIRLLSMVTHARLISRDMFQKRIEEGADIYMHEIIYPIMQGYDSVELKSDLTIIGSDQLFNEMLGRFYQEKFGQKPQVIITSVITPGLDGGPKQSKSLGNYIGLAHSPRDKFGRVMRLIDQLIEQYFVVYTDLPMEEISAMKDLLTNDPFTAKQKLAHAIVSRYHGKDVADAELEWWKQAFSEKKAPEDIPVIKSPSASMKAFDLVQLCVRDESISNSEIRRLFPQNAIELDGDKITDPHAMLSLKNGAVIKIGKRKMYRIECP